MRIVGNSVAGVKYFVNIAFLANAMSLEKAELEHGLLENLKDETIPEPMEVK